MDSVSYIYAADLPCIFIQKSLSFLCHLCTGQTLAAELKYKHIQANVNYYYRHVFFILHINKPKKTEMNAPYNEMAVKWRWKYQTNKLPKLECKMRLQICADFCTLPSNATLSNSPHREWWFVIHIRKTSFSQ